MSNALSDYFPAYPEVNLFIRGRNQAASGAEVVGLEVANFTEYSFNANYLTPTDAWSFTADAREFPVQFQILDALGQPAYLTIGDGQDDRILATGYIDSVDIIASRSGGIEYRIEGRDALSPVVDACADPLIKVKEGTNLLDAIYQLFSPFGWTDKSKYVEDNTALALLRGGRGKTKRSEAKGFGRKSIKDFQKHLFRPYPREGVFQFASRMSQRYGRWIKVSPDGSEIIISRPNFDQDVSYHLYRTVDENNILEGSVKYSVSEQPNIIVADGWAYAGEFGHSKLQAIIENKVVKTEDPDFAATFKRFPAAHKVESAEFEFPFLVKRNRVLYLHDDESTQQEHLEGYIKRELALLQKKSVTAHYTVEGHGQMVGGEFVPWTIDSMVKVVDKLAKLEEDMYVVGCTYMRSRSGGTTTRLELIRKNTLEF